MPFQGLIFPRPWKNTIGRDRIALRVSFHGRGKKIFGQPDIFHGRGKNIFGQPENFHGRGKHIFGQRENFHGRGQTISLASLKISTAVEKRFLASLKES